MPDIRRPLAGELYSIDRVTAVSADNERVEYRPFYSFKHASDREVQRRFWHATRQQSEKAAGQIDQGTEVFITLVDLDLTTIGTPGGTGRGAYREFCTTSGGRIRISQAVIDALRRERTHVQATSRLLRDARQLAENLGIHFQVVEIEETFKDYLRMMAPS